MFAELAKYPRILVSGPHRSGTTIAAEMIASDTGHRCVREEEINFSRLERLLELPAGVVVQAPFLAHCLHYPELEGFLVVMMLRNPEAIAASHARMRDEAGKVTGAGIIDYRLKRYHADDTSARLVYENWCEQRSRIGNYVELKYESLKEHPLWVSDRTRFHYRQTASGQRPRICAVNAHGSGST